MSCLRSTWHLVRGKWPSMSKSNTQWPRAKVCLKAKALSLHCTWNHGGVYKTPHTQAAPKANKIHLWEVRQSINVYIKQHKFSPCDSNLATVEKILGQQFSSKLARGSWPENVRHRKNVSVRRHSANLTVSGAEDLAQGQYRPALEDTSHADLEALDPVNPISWPTANSDSQLNQSASHRTWVMGRNGPISYISCVNELVGTLIIIGFAWQLL